MAVSPQGCQDAEHGSGYAQLAGVSLARGGAQALDRLDLTLAEPRVALIGRNGSGKSSLARLLNGLLLPDSGSVRMFGRETAQARSELPRDVGFVFQNPDHQAIFPTVQEELAFGLTQLGHGRAAARAGADAYLAENGCAALGPRPFTELSEGQKQLVCILAVLIMRPRLLVLDEPFASLDHVARTLLMRRLAALPQKILLVTHDLELIDGFDRVVWLDGGRVRGDGAPAKIVPAYLAAMGDLAGDGEGLL